MHNTFRSRLIYGLSITGGIVIFIMAVVLYLGLDIREKTDVIAQAQGEILSRISQVSDLGKLKGQEKEAQVALLKLNSALPQRDSLFGVSRDLGVFAETRNLAFGSKFGEEVAPKDGKPGFIKVEMNIAGSYDNIIGFLKDIETSSYFINPFSLDLTKQGVGYTGVINSEIFFSN
ncbi:MAG TPA: hypothetical protein VFE87_00455 [Candidatus Paceibacterota bacterium]|nr:hypothetical protein [Candidatus Paceibacterota bacterium]